MKKAFCLLPLIMLFFFSSCTTVSDRKRMTEYYSNDENYVTIVGNITFVDKGDNGSIIIWIEQSNNYHYFQQIDTFKIITDNYNELIKNDFIFEASEELYKFTSSEKIFWDGWFYPVVSVENISGEKVYLEFETGRINWINFIQEM